MGYAGTCLSRQEWLQAIKTSAAEARSGALHFPIVGKPDVCIDEIVEHLVTLVEAGQKGYAWWAAHLYAEILGAIGADIPQRLTVAMEALARQPPEGPT